MDVSIPRGRSRWNASLLLMLLVAFVVRLGAAFYVEQHVAQTPGQVCLIAGDADGYWLLADRLATGKDYSIYEPPRYVMRMPGFPLLLAVSRVVFGDSTLAARILLVLVSTAACGLTYWLGRELTDVTTSLWAAWYTAISPTMVLFGVLILSETAFATTLLASLIAIHRLAIAALEERPDAFYRNVLVRGLAAGLLAGIATYMRPTWLYVGPVIAVAVLVGCTMKPSSHSTAQAVAEKCGCSDELTNLRLQGGRRLFVSMPPAAFRIVVPMFWLLVGFSLAIAPWIIRNAIVTGHIVPTTLWVGPSLYDGLHPSATGDSDMSFFEHDQLMATMSEYDMDQTYRRRAMNFLFQNPWQSLHLALEKQRRYWSLVPNAGQFQKPLMVLVVLLAIVPLFFLSLVGAWCMRRDIPFIALTAGAIVLFAGLHLLFVGSLRYRLPAEYPLAVLAAAGLSRLWMRVADDS